jgi:hypothetical protein
MTTGIEFLKPPPVKKGRGPAKNKIRLVSTSIRLPKEIVEYFKEQYPYTGQAKMREILAEWVEAQRGGNP